MLRRPDMDETTTVRLDSAQVARAEQVANLLKKTAPGWTGTSRATVLREALRIGLDKLAADAGMG